MRGFVVLALAACALVAGGAASGQVASPSLTGEFLSSTTDATITSFECDDTGGTLSFEMTGIAAGPYPGTFTEVGTVTLGPRDIPIPGAPGQFRAPILSFEAAFEITSPLGTVTGTKMMVAQSDANFGICNESPGGVIPDTAQIIASVLRYEATLPDGSTDHGRTFANFNASSDPSGPTDSLQFREGFTSEEVIPPDPEPSPPALVVVTPPTAVNDVGSTHTVTATVTTATAAPASGIVVLFTVRGSVTTTGECTTDEQGRCDFTYHGPVFPGADLITACADSNEDGDPDPGEPCGEATKIWVLPVTTPGQVTGGGWITSSGGRVSFGFNAKSDDGAVKGNCNVIDHTTKAHVRCLTVDTLVVAATHATFFGRADVDGVATNYRIDVDDLGEPGTLDTFRVQTDSGYTAAGRLQGGNIQIHR